METITLGSTLAKPVETQEQCDAYAAMAAAVNKHNAACTVGDTLWTIEDKADCYEITEAGTVPEPVEQPTIPERVTALETANDDIILMMADLIGG